MIKPLFEIFITLRDIVGICGLAVVLVLVCIAIVWDKIGKK